MKRFSPLLALVVTLCASPGLLAQVELRGMVRYKEYILFEPILVKLYVKNTGPHPIWLHEHGEGIPGPAPAGLEPARLSFEIKNNRGELMDRKEFENIQGLLQALKIADLPRADLEKALEGLREIQKSKGVKHKRSEVVTEHMHAAEKALKGAYKLTQKQLNDPLGKEPVPLLKEVIVKAQEARNLVIVPNAAGLKGVRVQPQETVTLGPIDINTAYLMSKVDSYRMSAVVRIGNKQWTEKPPQFIDVFQGVELRKMTTLKPHRVWSLRKQNRPPRRAAAVGNAGIFLFLRVDDGNGRINFRVHTLDRMIGTSLGGKVGAFEPLMIVDPSLQIRVLHGHSPKVFMEHFFTPEGKLVKRIEYARGSGRIEYVPDENKPGNIRVKGLRPLKP